MTDKPDKLDPEEKELHRAAADGDLDKLSKLIKKASDINCYDDSCKTPLYIAVESGNIEAAVLLLSNGAEINFEESNTP